MIDKGAKVTKLTKKDSGVAIDAIVASISGALAKGDQVTLVGFLPRKELFLVPNDKVDVLNPEPHFMISKKNLPGGFAPGKAAEAV